MNQLSLNNCVVLKPWGKETAIYQTQNVAIWHLSLHRTAQTSLHSHPKKKTGLIVLSGTAQVSFMNGSHLLKASEKIMIREGVFHSTKAINNDLQLLEIETPNDKLDLIRLEDVYDRQFTPYESEESYIPNADKIDISKTNVIGECVLTLIKTESKEELINRAEAKIMILEGKVFHREYPIVTCGDIVDTNTLTRFASKFDATPMTFLEIKLI